MFVPEGQMRPRGYGIAWIHYDRYGTECFIVPFNFFARWLRSIWFFLSSSKASEHDRTVYRRGYDAGRRAWENYGRVYAKDAIKCHFLARRPTTRDALGEFTNAQIDFFLKEIDKVDIYGS